MLHFLKQPMIKVVSLLAISIIVSENTSFAFTHPSNTILNSPTINTKIAFSRNTPLFVNHAHASTNDLTIPQKSESVTDQHLSPNGIQKISRAFLVACSIFSIFATTFTMSPPMSIADEYGVEKEAPTLFTGESIMICVKRGPLGACQKTEERTPENDNDKAAKYFRDPGKKVIDKDLAMRNSSDGDMESALVLRLKEQTEDNKERNEQIVRMKTMANDQSANFGPFDRQVVIMNADGNSFTLLQSPQAMRLKKLGYIKDRRFVTQPTQEVIDQALEADGSGFEGLFKDIFGDKQD